MHQKNWTKAYEAAMLAPHRTVSDLSPRLRLYLGICLLELGQPDAAEVSGSDSSIASVAHLCAPRILACELCALRESIRELVHSACIRKWPKT